MGVGCSTSVGLSRPILRPCPFCGTMSQLAVLSYPRGEIVGDRVRCMDCKNLSRYYHYMVKWWDSKIHPQIKVLRSTSLGSDK
jgi:hypothetical protein